MASKQEMLLPEWTWVTDLDDLPGVLKWSGTEVPWLYSQVMVDVHGEWQDENDSFAETQDGYGDTGVVAGYSHENGNLRVVVFLDNPPQVLRTPDGSRPMHFLGSYVYHIGRLRSDDAPKPSLQEDNLDIYAPAAQVALYAKRAAVAAQTAADAATLVARYAGSVAREADKKARAAASGNVRSSDEKNDSPF